MVLCFGLYAVEYDACQLHVLGGEAVKTVANLAARRVILPDGVDDAVGIADRKRTSETRPQGEESKMI